MPKLPVPLYHGTSTLFLSGIIESGLGGKNPILDWGVLDFAQTINPLVQEQFSNDEGWMAKAQSFGWMVNQQTGEMNFQHGDTYLSASKDTAIRYAVSKRAGSELLSYSLDFLNELVRRKVPGVADKLYRRYPGIFELLDISCAPLLVEVRHVACEDLVDEHGRDAQQNITLINSVAREERDAKDVLLQQVNFRLLGSVPLDSLTIRFINVSRWDRFLPQYTLHSLEIP